MAVDPAAFVKWRYQQVLFSQPPWQSYRLFSSSADPCLLLTVLAADPLPILQGLLLFLSLPLCSLASLAVFELNAACNNKSRPGWSLELGADGSMGNQPPPPRPSPPIHPLTVLQTWSNFNMRPKSEHCQRVQPAISVANTSVWMFTLLSVFLGRGGGMFGNLASSDNPCLCWSLDLL